MKPSVNERQVVTGSTFFLGVMMLVMAFIQPSLWTIELFKVILQAVIVSGFIQTILAFHFAANKTDEAKTENSSKAFETMKSQAETISALTPNSNVDKPDLTLEAGQTATIEAKDGKS